MVVLDGQIVQKLLGVAVRGVHGGHTGVLFATEAVDQSAVNNPGSIAWDDAVQDLFDGGEELKRRSDGFLSGGSGELGAVEGQKPG